jgi:hypothetical protein
MFVALSRSATLLLLDPAVPQRHHAVEAIKNLLVMRDDQDRRLL